MATASVLARRTLADARLRTAAFAYLFAALAFSISWGYAKTYPTLAERLQLERTYGDNVAARLFYGTPHRLETIGGYASWRGGGLLAIFAAFLGAFLAVRALRGEEEAGRYELTAVGAIGRRTAFAARSAAVGASIVVAWLGAAIGLVAGGLPLGGSAYLALAIVSAAAVYAGVGALTSQLLPTRRSALGLASLVLGADLLLRMVADTTGSQWLHWAAPLGWAEELRAFADPRPAVLVLPAVASAALVAGAAALERRRDVGGSLLALADEQAPRLALLRSPVLLAARLQRTGLLAWSAGAASFAFVVGTVSKTVGSAGLSQQMRAQFHKIGSIQIATPAGYIGLTFLFFVLAISLYCCGQLAAGRDEEAEGRLEGLLALPVGRAGWLAGRLGLAAAGATAIAVAAGLGAAAGARSVGVDVSTLRLLGAGLNCLPVSVLFLGFGALLVAAAPRLGVGAAYALVSLAFVWELFGALLGAPGWLLGVSPFHQIGLVPAVPFRLVPALAMLGIGGAAAAGALVRFRGRDLAGL